VASPQTRTRLSADDWIAGGLTLLADEGVAGVKIDVLAARLGVTKGSFYWHFESLPTFLEALTSHYCAMRSAEAEAFDDTAPADPRDRLMYLMEQISDRSTRSLERAVRAWAESSNPKLAAHVREMDLWAFGEVLQCFEQLGFDGIDAQVRAKTLCYAGVGFVHTGSLGERERSEHRERLLALLTRAGGDR
jgi:AcrR family transcriptional regulator